MNNNLQKRIHNCNNCEFFFYLFYSMSGKLNDGIERAGVALSNPVGAVIFPQL